MTSGDLERIFRSPELLEDWRQTAPSISNVCSFADGSTDGVNPGDRRAVWYLIRSLRPTTVLEIGTHVGASMIHIASALDKNGTAEGDAPLLTTVDIEDVNDRQTGPWRRLGLKASPSNMLAAIGLADCVNFVQSSSLAFFDQLQIRFDFIFLDGDHSSATVYQELPRALNALNDGGLVLLHDYFPDNKPLWRGAPVAYGPYMAVQRLRNEGASIDVIPLGELPWMTKRDTSVTSLAIVTSRP